DALQICREAGAQKLALFHHAPERSDAEVDAILAETKAMAKRDGIGLDIVAAYEGLEIEPGRG
ncbi:MAG TPA: MBL fold metallo-hydrolase, partial [Polyangia bacterium]|nr:MBL fold metallo-hydrolase [Polyangia bacterium]